MNYMTPCASKNNFLRRKRTPFFPRKVDKSKKSQVYCIIIDSRVTTGVYRLNT